MENIKEIEVLGKMIGEKARLKILFLLKDQEINSSKIQKRIHLPQNLTSHHLQTLLKNKFVTIRKSGRFSYYSLNKQEIKKRIAELKTLI